MITRVLEKTGATVRAGGMIYKAVAHSVLLYGSESWVVTGPMIKVLGGGSTTGRPRGSWGC